MQSEVASQTREMLLEKFPDYQMVGVGITEFEKLEGCVTCLSVRMR